MPTGLLNPHSAAVPGRYEAFVPRHRILRHDHKSGFSLLELLVVIAVIALLAALLLPALSGAKRAAYSTACIGNLKQQALAVALFVADKGVYPSPGAFDAGLLADGHEPNLELTLQPYLDLKSEVEWTGKTAFIKTAIWRCPAEKDTRMNLALHGEGITYAFYGYNYVGIAPRNKQEERLGLGGNPVGEGIRQGGMPEWRPTKEAEVVAPFDMLCLGDGFSKGGSKLFVGTSGIGRGLFEIYGEPDARRRAARRHNSRSNVAFCDGHVQALQLESLYDDPSEASLRRWNRDHEPHRERLGPAGASVPE